eukprot:32952-Eustigmatos_ZCMA.PRE.1
MLGNHSADGNGATKGIETAVKLYKQAAQQMYRHWAVRRGRKRRRVESGDDFSPEEKEPKMADESSEAGPSGIGE